MSEKIHVELGNVQKTLFLPLWGRAVESARPRPILVDPTAARIIDQVDFDFASLTQNMDSLSQIAWIKRSQLCDRAIRRFLEQYPDGTIVNVGCGLDTTFERVDNGRLRWYDLDLPDVIALRRQFIQEGPRRAFIAASLLDEDWLQTLEIQGNVLFMVAGVLYYFEEAEVKGFVLRLLEAFPGAEMIFDVSSPLGVRVANKKVVESAGLDARSHLKWGLKKAKDLLAWDGRLQKIGVYYYFRTLRFGLRNFLLGSFSDAMGIQYLLHLRLGTPQNH